MKKVLLIIAVCCAAMQAVAQDKTEVKGNTVSPTDTLEPYQKYPTLPAFNILMRDSTTIFNTYNIPDGKPTAILFFDPDCKHCKHTIHMLLKGMDSVKNIQFYMITATHSMTNLRTFYDERHLAEYPNIKTVGRDYEFFFFGHYHAKVVPDIALYDEHKKLVKLIQGEFTASAIYDAYHEKHDK